jgi:hypothetical protein
MTERWRRSLDALGRSEPEALDLRERALRGPRLPDPPRRQGSVLVAGALSIALALASFSVLRNAFREGPDRPSVQTPSHSETGRLDPEELCDVPAYDPNVAVLGDDSSSVFGAMGPRQVPSEVLEGPGASASSIVGPATEALRSYLAGPQAVNAPSDGWRTIAQTADEVIFAAPPDGGYSDWWVTRFTMTGGEWKSRETELVEQHLTPAQAGHDLRLEWTDEVVLRDGVWTSSLTLVNDRGAAWAYGEDAAELWGRARVFDPETGAEIGHAAEAVGGWGPAAELGAGEGRPLPLSLGGALPDLGPGVHGLIACVPELGLASPLGTLRVVENPVVRTVDVLTYPYRGVGMAALGGGRLMVHNGCLAVADRSPRPIYVVWPDGYTMVSRQEVSVLIDAVGREVSRLGDEVTLGGGYVPLEYVDAATIDGLPEACRTGGQGYFLTTGLADG